MAEVKILLVEADLAHAKLVEVYLLANSNFKISMTNAKTLEECLKELSINKFEVVLLSLNLPDSKGINTLEKIRERYREQSIVVLTTDVDQNMGIRAVQMGAQDFLNKERLGIDSLYRTILYARERNRLIKQIEPLIKDSFDKRLWDGNFQDLPFCIKQFSFKNHQGIKNIHISELPINSSWIFLTGENGFGKTTILKALSKTLISRNIYQRLAVELKINNKNHLFDPLFSSIELQNFAAYGASRLTLQQPDAKNEIGRKSEVLYSLFNTDGILLNIEIELVFWKLENDPKFEKVKQLLISVVPDLKDITIQGREVMYIEKSSEEESYKAVTFDKLAAGYKSVIAMVGDIYLRLSKNQPDVEIKDLGGIVLIDELDVHLHPKWQRALPGLLSKAFPKVQFIASTHSPIPFLGAPKNAVFLKVDRTPEKGITCERIDIDVTNLTPNLILTSPIFGFGDITSVNVEEIGEVETEDTYKELKENEERRKRLLEFENSDRNFPDELFERKEKPVKPAE